MNTITSSQPIESVSGTTTGEICSRCKAELCQRQIVCNLALGYETVYQCIVCLAKEKKQPAQSLFNYLLRYIQTRPCYMIMWQKTRCSDTQRIRCEFRASCDQ